MGYKFADELLVLENKVKKFITHSVMGAADQTITLLETNLDEDERLEAICDLPDFAYHDKNGGFIDYAGVIKLQHTNKHPVFPQWEKENGFIIVTGECKGGSYMSGKKVYVDLEDIYSVDSLVQIADAVKLQMKYLKLKNY